jgi:histone-lysine N-methyltransferase ASH1L
VVVFKQLIDHLPDVFVGDAGSIWRNIKLQEYSTCVCLPETGCDEDCQNRFMFYECDSSNCRLDAETCGNRSFDGLKQRTKAGGKYNVGVEVIKTVDRGYGVRSNRTFDPNQIIVEYTGEIITQEDCEDRMHTLYKDNEVGFLIACDLFSTDHVVLLPYAL